MIEKVKWKEKKDFKYNFQFSKLLNFSFLGIFAERGYEF